jgi:predicted aspartyl protease
MAAVTRIAIPLLALAALASPSRGQEAAPQAAAAADAPETVMLTRSDRWARMTVPVTIDGRGPYAFVVDTGAERTVIARELATLLGLDEGRVVRVHSMTEVQPVQTVVIGALEVGGKLVENIHAPAFERRNLGAEGMLGVDSLQTHRVSFDFKRRRMTVVPSKRIEERWPEGTIVIKGRSRFGHLVLVDAAVDGQKVWVIVDTGSAVTIGNEMLRRQLERKQRLRATQPMEMVSVSGGKLTADQTKVRRIRIGGMNIQDMPIVFADVHPFKKLDLLDRPAILLGMDALQLFQRVSVDFANRRVRILVPDGASLNRGTAIAANPVGPRAIS